MRRKDHWQSNLWTKPRKDKTYKKKIDEEKLSKSILTTQDCSKLLILKGREQNNGGEKIGGWREFFVLFFSFA